MNKANKSARARTAVDVICATKLLVSMSSKRYHEKKEKTWKWQGELTLYNEKLRNETFDNINYCNYNIKITKCESKLTKRGHGHKERRCLFKKNVVGTVFRGCSCGIPYTDGIPCHHMVAVVKLSRIEGLTATESMPIWWSTVCWCNQYPANTTVTCNFDMDMLRTFPEDAAMRYHCPPYTAPRKAGHHKIGKRIKNSLKGKKKIKSIVSTQEAQLDAMDGEREISTALAAPRKGKMRSTD